MKQVSTVASVPQRILADARSAASNGYDGVPRVLDMFGGGGTIPYESALLGADTYSIDSNELSVFVQKSILVHAQNIPAAQLQIQVKKSGVRVLEQLTSDTAPLYPKRGKLMTYLWTYSTLCSNCGYRFYLSKRHWLSKKSGKQVGLCFTDGTGRQSARLSTRKDDSDETVWVGRNGTVQCPQCDHTMKADVQQSTDEVVAAVSSSSGLGKTFTDQVQDTLPPDSLIADIETGALKSLKATLPNSELPIWSGIVNPAVYGIRTHADFLNQRQRAVLVLLIKALRDEHRRLTVALSKSAADAVISLLSSLIDQVVDWNCRLSMWIPQNEQVGRAFCGPGIAMLWDYAETDPVSDGPSNLWSKLDRIVAGTLAVTQLPRSGEVAHGYAQDLPFADGFFDSIVTDPPYYDNIYYSVLADFFFSWKRVLLHALEPGLFRSTVVDSKRELVASTFRSGAAAHEDYCNQLQSAIREAERVLKPDGVFALLYSHSSINGWEALVRAYRPTCLSITSVQPLSIERKQRPRAMTSDAVNTCVAFVAHKGERKSEESLDSMCSRLREFAKSFKADLSGAGWQDGDIAVAVYAQSVAMLMNVTKAVGCSTDAEALKAFEIVVRETFSDFKITSRRSL